MSLRSVNHFESVSEGDLGRSHGALQRLPGIGPKTAQRLTFFLLKRPPEEVRELADSLRAVKEKIVHCSADCEKLKSARGTAVTCTVKDGRLIDDKGQFKNGPETRFPLCTCCP